MVRLLVLIAVFCINHSFGQQVEIGSRAGLIQVSASIYPSIQFNKNISNNYVGGHLAYFLTDNYSIRGDVFSFISSRNKLNAEINDQFQIQVGFLRHFRKNRFNVYIGGQMGLSILQVSNDPRSNYQPVLTGLVGVQYHVFDYFYFYAESLYMFQQQPLNVGHVDQLLFTGGLGLQLPTRKP